MQPPGRTPKTGNPFQTFLSAYPKGAAAATSLHYLIATGASEVDVGIKIKQLKRKKQFAEVINTKETAYQVTCLHLSVMRGDRNLTERLIANRASLKEQDVNGCTPLHLAAMLENEELLQYLLAESDLTIRTLQSRLFATAEEIRSSMREPNYAADKIVGYLKTGNEPPCALTPAQFKSLTGATFCPYLLVTRAQHIVNWLKPPVIGVADPFLNDQARLFISQPAALCFEEERTFDGSKSLGLGVRTLRSLPCDAVFDFYGGKYSDFSDSIYKMDFVEALHHCTPISRANEGDPNCMLISGWVNGVELPIALTTCPIPEGGWVHYNYGKGSAHSCKWGHYSFAPSDDFEEFVKQVDYEKEVCRNAALVNPPQGSLPPTLNEYLASIRVHNRIEFIFDTPYVLSRLLIEGKIAQSVCKFVLSFFARHRTSCNPQQNAQFKRLFELMHLLIEVLNKLETCPEKAKSTAIKNYLLKLLDSQRVIVALQELHALLGISTAIEKWEEYQKEAEKVLEAKEKILHFSIDLLKPEKAEQAKKAIRQLLLEQISFFSLDFAQIHIVQACDFTVDTATAEVLDEIVMVTVAEGNKAP